LPTPLGFAEGVKTMLISISFLPLLRDAAASRPTPLLKIFGADLSRYG